MPVQVKTSEVQQPVSKFTQVPLGVYTVQIVKVEQTPSKKGAAQDKLVCEILSPESVETAGGVVNTAGREFDFYLTYSTKNLWNCQETLKALGVPLPEDISVPTEQEVLSGSYTRIPEIQDITLSLVGGQFEIKLSSTRLAAKVKEGEPGYRPGLAAYQQPDKMENGAVVMSDLFQVNLPNLESIVSPISNLAF